MFVRVAFLLLLLNILADTAKIHDSVKALGKRYMNQKDKKKWEAATEEEAKGKKFATAGELAAHLTELTSVENKNFELAFDYLFAQMHPDAVAEVCGDEKKLNKFQYFKLLRSASTQYTIQSDRVNRNMNLLHPSKDDLQVWIYFNQTDKNGLTAEMQFKVILIASFDVASIESPSIFSIMHISHGGSCFDHGNVKYTSSEEVENVEYLQSHPDGMALLNLFTPSANQISDDTKFNADEILPNPLPSGWVSGLTSDAKIQVCHEKETVDYSIEQFKSWYQRFGQMWHPKKGDNEAMKMQIIEQKDEVLVARVTFKLQIGINDTATVHDWNFKFAAKQNEDNSWSITQVDVLCAPTVTNLMDENYLAYPDVIGATFNNYVQDNEQWYFATDFGQHFKKYGSTVKLWSCGDSVEEFDDLPKTFYVQRRLWTATMKGYLFLEPREPVPATENFEFTMRVKMQHPTENALYKPPKGYILGSDWKFMVKWDKMDQFYYIYQAEFACPSWMIEKTNAWAAVYAKGTFQRLGKK